VIRAARPDDAVAIAEVEAAATPVPWTASAVAASLASSAVGAWVLERDGHVVGHLLASAQGPEGEVLIVAVHPDHRRQGGARRLLDAAEAFWAERGVDDAFLEVRADNDGARALYRASGWSERGRRVAYYRDGVDAIVLGKALRSPT